MESGRDFKKNRNHAQDLVFGRAQGAIAIALFQKDSIDETGTQIRTPPAHPRLCPTQFPPPSILSD
jgi:hypothetical protein